MERPPFRIHACHPERREPGFIVLPVGKAVRAISRDSVFEALVALDREGKVAWQWRSPGSRSLMDVKRTPRDTLLVMTTDGCISEVAQSGDILRAWSSPGRGPQAENAIPVDTLYFHHSVQELPDGNFAALSLATRTFDDYPLSEADPAGPRGRRELAGDTVVEFAPDGAVVREHDFFDILDPGRIGYGLDAPFWTIAEVAPGAADWTHANGLIHDPSDDSFIVTVRHQDCAIKIDRQSGALKWILGTPDGWREPWAAKLLQPAGRPDWFWHPHDPSLMQDGSLLLFDNGESGAFPPVPKPDIDTLVSRAIAYRIDETAMTCEPVWSFAGPYSMYVSGAQELPQTGNVFATFGGITLTRPDGRRTDLPPRGYGSAEVFEVTRTDPPEILFHAELNDRDSDAAQGWAIFRAERVPPDWFGGSA